MLARGLTALLNQALTDAGPNLKYVYTEENNLGDPVRSLIRERKIGMLSTYIDRTGARLKEATATAAASGGKKA